MELTMKRRHFLGLGATLTLCSNGITAAGGVDTQRRLLVVLLRGGMDGLSAVPPLGDRSLTALRGNLVPQNTLRGNDFFGIHPALAHFSELLAQGSAVAVHSTGFAYTGRSHFEGQDIMQSGLPKPYASSTGWLGRAMDRAGTGTGVAISIPMPLLLRGDSRVETQFPNWMRQPSKELSETLAALWANDLDLNTFGQRMVRGHGEMGDMQQSPSFNQRKSPAGLAREAALRMGRSGGPTVGLIDFTGFDTHANQGAAEGNQANKIRMIDEVVQAFHESMGPRWSDSLVITVTEFGRTAAENGTTGTDHGWGSCILAAGGLVRQPGVVADWPGLEKNQLFEGRDLKVTLDAAAVYARMLQSVFGLEPAQIQSGILSHKPHPLAEKLFAI